LADQVEITNVGGENGVASEATLASLTRAIEKLAASTGKDPKKEAGKIQKTFNESLTKGTTASTKNTDALKKKTDATKKATQATANFAKSLAGAATSAISSVLSGLTGFAKELFNGGDSLTDFAQHIPVIGGLITPFTQMLDNSISTFRELSSVGASFGNSITEMRRTAADLELNLDEMARLVSTNSESLRLLGGTVNSGVSRFAAINRNIKATGDFAALKNMGFTIEEVNEGIADYAALQSRLGRLQGMSTQQLASGSANYLKQLDMLSKITGKSRKELEATMATQAQDAGFRALMSQFEEGSKEAENFRNSMALIETLPADVATGLKDLADGIPQTEEGIALLQAAGPEIMEAMRQVASGADPQVLLNALKKAGGDIEKFAGVEEKARAAYIQSIRQSNPVLASILDSATRLTEVGSANVEEARREQQSREEITSTLTTFDDAIKSMRATIAKAILDSGLFEDLAGAVSAFAGFISSEQFKNGLKQFVGVITSFIDDIRNVGFGQAIKNLFSSDGPLADALKGLQGFIGPVIGSAFSAIGKGLVSWFLDNWDTILIGALAGIGAILAAPIIGVFGAIGAGIVAMIGWETIKGLLEDAWNAITGVFTGIGDWWSSLSISSIFSDAWAKITNVFSFGNGEESSWSISSLFSNVWNSVTSIFDFSWDFSISDLFSNVWNSVTSIFDFSWDFSISDLFSNVWNSVTDFFSLDGIRLPSISGMFSNITDSVKDFFSFDFELPNFRDFLPSWLGGKGKSLDNVEQPQPRQAGIGDAIARQEGRIRESLEGRERAAYTQELETGNALGISSALLDTQNVMSQFAELPDLQRNLDIINAGLDTSEVLSYNEAMENLVKTLQDLNEVLSEDNKGIFGRGSGVAAKDVIGQMRTATPGGTDGINQLNKLMGQMLAVLTEMSEDSKKIEKNTKGFGNNIASGYVSTVRG
jgi:hypothetical protein